MTCQNCEHCRPIRGIDPVAFECVPIASGVACPHCLTVFPVVSEDGSHWKPVWRKRKTPGPVRLKCPGCGKLSDRPEGDSVRLGFLGSAEADPPAFCPGFELRSVVNQTATLPPDATPGTASPEAVSRDREFIDPAEAEDKPRKPRRRKSKASDQPSLF